MKLTHSVLALSLLALLGLSVPVAADSFDSQTATIQKASASSAKVMVAKDTYTAPISFADGADWSTVKDHYEVADAVVTGLAKHKIAISIGADGGASFTRTK